MRISDWSSDVCSADLRPWKRAFRSRLRATYSSAGMLRSQAQYWSSSSRPARARRSASLAFSADCWLSDICSNSSRLLELRSARTAGERLSHHAFCLAISDRKSVVSGKSVSVRVDLGGRRIIKTKREKHRRVTTHTNENNNGDR